MEFLVGMKILHPHTHLHLPLTHFNLQNLMKLGPMVYRSMFFGAFLIGIPAAAIAFFVIRRAAIRWQQIRLEKASRPPGTP